MIEIRKIHPAEYSSLGFIHVFCNGCKYEFSSLETEEDERIKKCNDCMPVLDAYYKEKQPIFVLRDDSGKNIAKSIDKK